MTTRKMILSLSVFAFAILASAQFTSAQGLPTQDTYGGGIYGLGTSTSGSNYRPSTRSTGRTGNFRVNPGYQVKPRSNTRHNPGYQVRPQQPQRSWKQVWSTTAYADQAWGMKRQLEAQGYRVQTRSRTIPYQGRYVYVVDIYCYLYQ